ncbi:MAG: prepilin-type N-terminal cleavage/methylation domain-containing protein [Gemmatimonadaceae bacterium]
MLKRAVTLVELLVVLVLIGIVAGVVGLTMNTTPALAPPDPIAAAVAAGRDSAIRSGHTVTITLHVDDGQRSATATPDGRVLADTSLGIDPLTGMRDAAP